MENKPLTFKQLEIGERFFSPSTCEDFAKVSETKAEFLTGGNYYTGEIVDFDPEEIVYP